MATKDINGFDSPSFARVKPVNNVTPFTYQDGTTFLEILERMQRYIQRELIPGVNNELNQFIDNINDFVGEVEKGLEVDRQRLHDIYAEFVAIVSAKVDLINNKTGPMDIQRATLSAPYTVTVSPLWPNNQPVYFALTQDATGGRPVTLSANITGPLDVNTSPNGITEFWLFPKADKTSWYVYQPASALKNTVNDKSVSGLIGNKDTATRKAVDALFTPVIETLTEQLDNSTEASENRDADTRASLTQEVNRVNRLYPLGDIDVVFIGDSYFTGDQGNGLPRVKDMPTRVTEILNAKGMNNYRMHNYSVAATGFVRGGSNNYAGQLNRAMNDTNIKNCRIVVIGGGQNDAGTDVYLPARDMVKQAKAKWPNAQIVMFPMWTPGHFRSAHRVTFMAMYRVAKDFGLTSDTNSLWVNSLTNPAAWVIASDGVYHPADTVTEQFAYAICSVIDGARLPAQSTDIAIRQNGGISVGVVAVDGLTATLSFQQHVPVTFDASYLLGSIGQWALTPGEVHQYVPGFIEDGGKQRLFTIEAGTGSIFLNGPTPAGPGLAGFTASYPLGM